MNQGNYCCSFYFSLLGKRKQKDPKTSSFLSCSWRKWYHQRVAKRLNETWLSFMTASFLEVRSVCFRQVFEWQGLLDGHILQLIIVLIAGSLKSARSTI